MTNWKIWFKGLVAALVGAVSGVLLDVAQRWAEGGAYDPKAMKRMVIGVALMAVVAYLKKSPLYDPPKESK